MTMTNEHEHEQADVSTEREAQHTASDVMRELFESQRQAMREATEYSGCLRGPWED